jgi:hypothetical protein
LDIPTQVSDPDFIQRVQDHLLSESSKMVREKIHWHLKNQTAKFS